jgi:hypothetical protein
MDVKTDMPLMDVIIRTVDPTLEYSDLCFTWAQAEAIVDALRKAGFLK